MSLLVKFFGLAFSALLPVINPLGSALVFLGLVAGAPAPAIRTLSRQIAISTTLFLIGIELLGTAILTFFGISLPVVQVGGGLVLAAMGWNLLNQDVSMPHGQSEVGETSFGSLEDKIFYPFTFPVTAGPGTVVVMLTLSAHASAKGALPSGLAHAGILLAVLALSVLVYLTYANAPKITARMSPQRAQGILRIVAFVLLCIGVQIMWNGVQSLLKTALK